MTKKAKEAGKKKLYRAIKDDRIVHGPMAAYTYFFKARNDSGDLNGMSVGERGKLVGQEWKALSAAQKKVCSRFFLLFLSADRMQFRC